MQLVASLLGLESTSLSETEWLRRDNEALRHENARLHQEIGQWKSKFHEWVRSGSGLGFDVFVSRRFAVYCATSCKLAVAGSLEKIETCFILCCEF